MGKGAIVQIDTLVPFAGGIGEDGVNRVLMGLEDTPDQNHEQHNNPNAQSESEGPGAPAGFDIRQR